MLRKLVQRAKDVIHFARTGSTFNITEVTIRPDRDPDRAVRELYWKFPAEVNEPGMYVTFMGGFHVPRLVSVMHDWQDDSKFVEFKFAELGANGERTARQAPLNTAAMYLGPLPMFPESFNDL